MLARQVDVLGGRAAPQGQEKPRLFADLKAA